MGKNVIEVCNLSKQYRLGQIGTGSIRHDLNRWWHNFRGKEDPYLQIGERNDRTTKGESDYVWALKNISFAIKAGDVLGIIGRNGAGKSTLLKILSRTTTPTVGKIKIRGRAASLLEVGTGFHPDLTGRENIYLNGAILGMRRHEIDRKLDEIVGFSGVERYIDTPVKRYSSGMYVRLAFAVAAYLEPDILIVDEVLAVGDMEFQKKCLGKMKDVSKNAGRTVLFVSHNMDAIKNLCKSSIYLKNGEVAGMGDNTDIINQYLRDSELKRSNVFTYEGDKPKIVKVELDEKALAEEKLIIKMYYRSPFKIQSINPGIVIYNVLNTPIFGSNTRFHPKEVIGVSNSKDGWVEITVPKIQLHTGIYNVSCWLGDEFSDYDFIESGLSFEYQSQKNYSSRPDPLIIGSVDNEAYWRVEN